MTCRRANSDECNGAQWCKDPVQERIITENLSHYVKYGVQLHLERGGTDGGEGGRLRCIALKLK